MERVCIIKKVVGSRQCEKKEKRWDSMRMLVDIGGGIKKEKRPVLMGNIVFDEGEELAREGETTFLWRKSKKQHATLLWKPLLIAHAHARND